MRLRSIHKKINRSDWNLKEKTIQEVFNFIVQIALSYSDEKGEEERKFMMMNIFSTLATKSFFFILRQKCVFDKIKLYLQNWNLMRVVHKWSHGFKGDGINDCVTTIYKPYYKKAWWCVKGVIDFPKLSDVIYGEPRTKKNVKDSTSPSESTRNNIFLYHCNDKVLFNKHLNETIKF